jgi:hypothetical protein
MRKMQKSQHNAAIHGLQITLQSLRPTRKYPNLGVVLVLGVLGYLVGPDNMPMGNYTAEIDEVKQASLLLIPKRMGHINLSLKGRTLICTG